MAVIGTFGSFTTARLGIYASQASLQVTGNNIANINTKGYTRQRADLYSLNSTGTSKYANPMGVDIGYGVLVKSTTQLRDPYLDIRYRNENTKLGAANATLAGLQKISQTLDEVNKGADGNGVIENALMNFETMLKGLSIHVGSEEYDGLVREAAKSLTTFFNTAAKNLEDDWNVKADELKKTVDEVNDCLTNIRNLNEQIRKQGIYGDLALELRDARNLEIDKLSEYLAINVEYSLERIDQYTDVEKLTITLKDTEDPRNPGHEIKLVDGLYAGQLSFSTEEVNPKYNAAELQEAQLNDGPNPKLDDDGKPYLYLDESGEGTNDITKANMVKLNPHFYDYPAALNPNYDEKDPTKGGKYIKYGTTDEYTDNVSEAARVVINPDYKKSILLPNPEYETDKTKPPYLAEDGKTPTDDPTKAKHVLVNPQYDPEDTDSLPYLDKDGKPANAENAANIMQYLTGKEPPEDTQTNDVTEAQQVGKYLNDKGEVVDEAKDAAPASRKYLTDPKYVGGTGGVGPETNDPDKAAKVDPNKFLLQLERLEDKFNRPLDNDKPTESVTVPLDDVSLTGALQSMRELLTEEGEFASKDDAGIITDPDDIATLRAYLEKLTDANGDPMYDTKTINDILGNEDARKQVVELLKRSADPKANIKMGIPYYQKRLDLLAKKFAETFNEANQMPASTVYETGTGADAGKFVDKNGNVLQKTINGTTSDLTIDDVTVEVAVLDSKGNAVMENGQVVTERAPYDSPSTRVALKAKLKAENPSSTDEQLDTMVNAELTDEKIKTAAECLEILRDKGQLKKEYSYYDGGVLFSNNGNTNDPTGINAKNITISNSWAARTVRVLNSKNADYPVDPSKPDGDWVIHSSDNSNINHMMSLFEKKLNYSASEIEPDAVKGSQIFFEGSFQEMYTNLGATLGSQTNTMDGIAYNYEIMTLNIDNNRLSVSGVDLNDEATSMMQFQKSYQAACRLLTTIDSMLDTLINGTLR